MEVDLNSPGVYVLFNSTPVVLDISHPFQKAGTEKVVTYEHYSGMSITNLKRRIKSHSFTYTDFWAQNEPVENCREKEKYIHKRIAMGHSEDILSAVSGYACSATDYIYECIRYNNPSWTRDQCYNASGIDAIHWHKPGKKSDYKEYGVNVPFEDLKPTQYEAALFNSKEYNGEEWKWGMDPLRGFSKFYAQDFMSFLNAFINNNNNNNNKWIPKEEI